MHPELISEKIHFYIWKHNINNCHKEYHNLKYTILFIFEYPLVFYKLQENSNKY